MNAMPVQPEALGEDVREKAIPAPHNDMGDASDADASPQARIIVLATRRPKTLLASRWDDDIAEVPTRLTP